MDSLDENIPSNQAILLALSHADQEPLGLHLSGLRHGDIKPENILIPVDAPQNASWIDFGLSDRPESPWRYAQLSLAPEALNGRPELASDLFALGKVIETVSTAPELRELANNLTSWNPRERFCQRGPRKSAEPYRGNRTTQAPRPHQPMATLARLLPGPRVGFPKKTGGGISGEGRPLNGRRDMGERLPQHSRSNRDGTITLDALSALLSSADKEPTINDPHHYVLESLRQQAQGSPLIVEAGQRIFESPTDQLALRFARNDEDYPGIVWLSWGESSPENPWPGRVVKVPSWSEQDLSKLTALYRPELVQPQKVTAKVALTCAGAIGKRL